MVARTRRANDAQAARDGELAEHAAHPARGGAHDDDVALLQVLRLEGVPRRLTGERETRRDVDGHALGHAGHHRGVGNDKVGERALRDRAEHGIPHREVVDARPDRLDDPRELAAHRDRQGQLDAGAPRADLPVDRVQPARGEPHAHLALPGRGYLVALDEEHLRATELVIADNAGGRRRRSHADSLGIGTFGPTPPPRGALE